MKIEIYKDNGQWAIEREGDLSNMACPFNGNEECTWFCPHFGYTHSSVHLTCGAGREWDGTVLVKEDDDES